MFLYRYETAFRDDLPGSEVESDDEEVQIDDSDKELGTVIQRAIMKVAVYEHEMDGSISFKGTDLNSKMSGKSKLVRIVLTMSYFLNFHNFKAERNILNAFNILFGYPNLSFINDSEFSIKNLDEMIKAEERKEREALKSKSETTISANRRRRFTLFLDKFCSPEFKTTSKNHYHLKRSAHGTKLQDFSINPSVISPFVGSNIENRESNLDSQFEYFKNERLAQFPPSSIGYFNTLQLALEELNGAVPLEAIVTKLNEMLDSFEINDVFDKKLKFILDIYCSLKSKVDLILEDIQGNGIFDALSNWILGQFLYDFSINSTYETTGDQIKLENFKDLAMRSNDSFAKQFNRLKLPIGDILCIVLSKCSFS